MVDLEDAAFLSRRARLSHILANFTLGDCMDGFQENYPQIWISILSNCLQDSGKDAYIGKDMVCFLPRLSTAA